MEAEKPHVIKCDNNFAYQKKAKHLLMLLEVPSTLNLLFRSCSNFSSLGTLNSFHVILLSPAGKSNSLTISSSGKLTKIEWKIIKRWYSTVHTYFQDIFPHNDKQFLNKFPEEQNPLR